MDRPWEKTKAGDKKFKYCTFKLHYDFEGVIVFCLTLMFIGGYMINVSSEQSIQETKSFMLYLGGVFLFVGIIGIIILIVAGIVRIIKPV